MSLAACREKQEEEKLFSLLDPLVTGLDFSNELPVQDSLFNILDYIYYFNGGGVAIGDINNDGLPDIFFSSNLHGNRLYLNKGKMKFEDISEKAGIRGGPGWKTGVTMADVNGDGWLDIYVCAVGSGLPVPGKNELFINNGQLGFKESAEAYGLDIAAYSTQAGFFDYDKDGDLDMFLVCHAVHSVESFGNSQGRFTGDSFTADKLFRNDTKNGKTHFTEVSEEAGIYRDATGYGLSLVIADFNGDHWEDIYVSNDFHDNDYYYINQQNGKFTENSAGAFGHQSRFSMGADAADINNDGWTDMITLDMLPESEKVLKSSMGDDGYDINQLKLAQGFGYQVARNCLQLNTGQGRFFSETGLFAGVAATDWSWSPLLADYDNDGITDLFISNGIPRRPNDLDYVKFAASPILMKSLQNGKSADMEAIAHMPDGAARNYFFRGKGNGSFQDESASWSDGPLSYSNGAAYADLDLDGDLDIVVNNINRKAFLYQNNAEKHTTGHYLEIELKGTAANPFAVGASVRVFAGQSRQLRSISTSRGFQSASSSLLHVGLGNSNEVDSIQVYWPSGNFHTIGRTKANQLLTIKEDSAFIKAKPNPAFIYPPDISSELGVDWIHRENNFNDFDIQPLMPHMLSKFGPTLAVADINGDGLDDFYVGGARGQAGRLYVQNKEGNFVVADIPVISADSLCEDESAVFFDANGDGFADLYVCSGGNEFWGKERAIRDRLYINDGSGRFSRSDGLPEIFGNHSVAIAMDYDKDGDNDVFIGTGAVSREYGKTDSSWLLLNDGKGRFRIADGNSIKGLEKAGLVRDACWADINGDGWQDLVITGEWMPVMVFINQRGRLEDRTESFHLSRATGLWQTVRAADIDNNGTIDLLLGNWGENSKLKADSNYPLLLYRADPGSKDHPEPLLAIAKEGRYYPFHGKEELEKRMPYLRKKFASYASMAGKDMEAIFGSSLDEMKVDKVYTLSSMLLRNNGKQLTPEKLPDLAQWSPVFSFLPDKSPGGLSTGWLLAGNFSGVNPFEGRYDASAGVVLYNGDSSFRAAMAPYPLQGEVRHLAWIKRGRFPPVLIVAVNNNRLRMYK